jgi:hypothetical protein
MPATLRMHVARQLRATHAAWIASMLEAIKARLMLTYPTVDLRGTTCASPMDAFHVTGGLPALVDVALEQCRWAGASALSYARDEGHPYVRTLLDYEAGCVDYAQSYLKAYWRAWQPPTLAEFYGLRSDECHHLLRATPPMHDVMPWSAQRSIGYMENREWLNDAGYRALDAEGCPPASSCGPKPDWYGEARFEHLIGLYQRIKVDGYRDHARPALPYFQQHAVGQLLLTGDQCRVVLLNGQHRAAILAALGYRRLPVIVHAQSHRGPTVVRREEAHLWPLVRRHVFSVEQALAIFDAVFHGEPPAALVRLHDQHSRIRRSESERCI